MTLFNIIKRNRKRDEASRQSEMRRKDSFDMNGKLEISAYKNGELISYDEGENTVTVFAKHATMHLLTGEAFTSHGEQRSFDEVTNHTATDTGEGANSDETVMSGQQYFSTNTSPDYDIDSRWTKNTLVPSTTLGDLANTDPDTVKYPFFPTKFLFGTGFEFQSWSLLGTSYPNYQAAYTDLGWSSGVFNTNITGLATKEILSMNQGIFSLIFIFIIGTLVLLIFLNKKKISKFLGFVTNKTCKTYPKNRIKGLTKKKVYNGFGDYIGKVESMTLKRNRINKLKIKLDKKFKQKNKIKPKGIIVNYKHVKNVGHILILKKNVLKLNKRNL